MKIEELEWKISVEDKNAVHPKTKAKGLKVETIISGELVKDMNKGMFKYISNKMIENLKEGYKEANK